MKLKTVLWAVGIVFGLGVFSNIISTSNTSVQGISTSVTPTIATATLAPTNSPTQTARITLAKPTFTPTPKPIHIAPTATSTPIPTVIQSNGLSNDSYYTNVDGNQVHSPAYSNSVPAGATAVCGDGTYSFSQQRSGTCSHHGGVVEWL